MNKYYINLERKSKAVRLYYKTTLLIQAGNIEIARRKALRLANKGEVNPVIFKENLAPETDWFINDITKQ